VEKVEGSRKGFINIYLGKIVDGKKDMYAKYARKVKKEPFIITKEGKPVAALVSIANADIETVSLSNDPDFIRLIERSRTRQKTEGGISPKEMRHRLGNQ
jgi:hypothetical protein